jgi:hypothetical protein
MNASLQHLSAACLCVLALPVRAQAEVYRCDTNEKDGVEALKEARRRTEATLGLAISPPGVTVFSSSAPRGGRTVRGSVDGSAAWMDMEMIPPQAAITSRQRRSGS